MTVELALPCQVVALTMRLGRDGQLTTLEDLVAQVRQTGRTALTDLANFLKLPLPIIKDVAIDMWHRGFMTFDLDTGMVDLTDVTREILSRDGPSGQSDKDVVTLDFLFEPITGRVLRQSGVYRPPERSLRMPFQGDITESDLDQGELVLAVQAALRADEQRIGRPTVLEVSFGNPLLRTSTTTRWVTMHVSVQRYPQGDQVTVTPVDSSWRVQDTQRLNGYLGRLADEEPNHALLQSLRGQAQQVLRPPPRVQDLLERLGEAMTDLASTRSEQVDVRNRELRRLAVRIRERLEVDRAAHATITLVDRAEGHAWALDDLIDSARTQLIIVSPELVYQRVHELLPALTAAADRGVQVVILWGRTLGDDLPGPIDTAFATLRDRCPDRVLIARRSARTEACLVVQDDRRAMVGAHGALSGRGLGSTATSVLVGPVGDEAPRAVVDLLLWGRRQYPHWQEGQRIKLHPNQFGRSDAVVRRPAALDVALPEVGEQVDEPVIRLWAQSWVEHHAALLAARSRSEARGPIVDVVADGEHRTLLGDCLRGARRRLIVTDDRIDVSVADDAYAQEIRDRRSAGVTVLLIHPQLPGNAAAENRFGTLGSGPDRIPVRRERAGARLLLSDDQLLIGSFSPLAGGHGRQDRVAHRRSHIGLHIQSEAVAVEVAGLLRAEVAPPSPIPDREEYVSPAERPSAAALPLLFAARAASPGRLFAEQVVRGLRDVPDPWTVIDDWHRTEVSTPELRTAVAALLRADRQVDSASGMEWTRWLVHDAWHRRAFVEAALIADLLTDEASDLRTTALLATAIEFGPVDVVADAALELVDGADPGAKAAGATGALADMLLWADDDGKQALELLRDSLSPAWQQLADNAIRFAFAGVPVPLDSLVGEHRRASDRLAVRERREQVIAEIAKLRQLRRRFDFDTGQALYADLFAPEGLLTAIDEACRDPADVPGELRDRLPADVLAYLNGRLARAGVPPMQWYRQGRYLRYIEDIVRSARVAANARTDSPAVVDPALNAACLALGTHLVGAWDLLFTEAKSVPEPYDQPFLALLERLNPLVMWARERL